MKNQALFSSKDKSEKLKCRLLQFLCGALRVKPWSLTHHRNETEARFHVTGTTQFNKSMVNSI